VWQDYEALMLHFEEAQSYQTRHKKDRCTYEGLLKKITSVEFGLGLGLMCDALQELSELSVDLKHRDIDLYKADKKIKTLVKVFEERCENIGPYYHKSLAAAKCLTFQGIKLHKKDRKDDPPPPRFVQLCYTKT
jgi:hypothetical protein